MPTISEVIARVAEVRPDAYDDKTKAKWLRDLDLNIWKNVVMTHMGQYGYNVDPDDCMDSALIVQPPHDRLYDLYLMCMIDFQNREYENYNNSALAFNDALDNWRREYHRTHMPLPGPGVRGL